ncbi:2943_t:CDS:1, partial [Scutellospora calospora]
KAFLTMSTSSMLLHVEFNKSDYEQVPTCMNKAKAEAEVSSKLLTQSKGSNRSKTMYLR